LNDFLYALRILRNNPGFTAVAIATIALGIGANTATFSIVDTVVFRPLPYEEPDRLVKISGSSSAQSIDDISWPEFVDIRGHSDVFVQTAADDGSGFTITHADGSREPVNGAFVTTSWLSTLGVSPILGRDFLVEESQPGRDRVAILGNAYWRRRFASDPNVIGRTIAIDGASFTIIGVLPPNILRDSADFLKPLVPDEYPQARDHRDLDVFARLKPGATLSQARTVVETIARRLEREFPAVGRNRHFMIVPLGKYYAATDRRTTRSLVLMLGAVGLVLLIACANVASLLLSRAAARSRECMVRTALGASRSRLVRQLLVESVVLFVIGGALGTLLAAWSVEALLALAVANGYVPERMFVVVDGRILLATLLLSLGAGIAFGLAPALRASRVDIGSGLRDASGTSTGTLHQNRTTRLLIVSELALSVVLLVSFGLMVRSFARVQSASSGIDPENLLVTAAEGGRTFSAAVSFWQSVIEHTRGVPGAESVAVTSRPPVHGARQQTFEVEGLAAVDAPRAGDILISPDYFRAMGIRLVKGRAFNEADTGSSPPVVIVSQSLARRHFGENEPLGRRIRLAEREPMRCCAASGAVEGVWREIVGVVDDVRQGSLDEPVASTIYRPYTQIVEHDMFLVVRAGSASAATRIGAELRSHLLAIDRSKEWADVRLMSQIIAGSDSIKLRRFILILLGWFSGAAMFLAAVGTYGVMTYSVAARSREIGIRVALGATQSSVFRQVLGDSIKLTAAGLVLGVVAAYAATRFIASMLFGITAVDLPTYAGVAFVLTAVAILSAYLPARRATKVDPLVALRHE
jgi:putative ABC transport system permease protein